MKRSIKILWITVILGVIVFNVLIWAINAGWLGYMPQMKELENPKSAMASEIYSSEGSLIGKYYLEYREPVSYSEISSSVVDALVATEDERFYKHSGIDPEAIGRALFGVITFNPKGGASTITQQLAKQLLEQGSKNLLERILEKLKEQIVAVKLEKNLTKSEIITLYLNTVPFGNNAFGIKTAAKTYFNKSPKDLNTEEAALLVGMLKGTSLYNPRRHPERAKERRNVVIDQMVKNFKVSASQGQELKDRPITLDFVPVHDNHHEGVAPYFRQVVEQEVKAWCKTKGLNLYKDGLKIYTTIDTVFQRYAEEAVAKQMHGKFRTASAKKWEKHKVTLMRAVKATDRYKELKESGKSEEEIMKIFNTKTKMKVFTWHNSKREKDTTITPLDSIKYMKGFVQTGFMAMDPASGEVKAWVGGINHKWFQFDHINTGTKRQVGSTIKPLLYCLAIDNGYSPCQAISLGKAFFPGHGWYGPDRVGGAMQMKQALAYSKNNATVNILKLVGIEHFVKFLKTLGVESKVNAFPSVCLGADDISVYEMLRAYTMFPNYGINTKPIMITRIEDRNGNVLETFVPDRKEVINEITAYKMIRMMMGTVLFGTGKRLKPAYGIKGECAGKTGTTNSESDAWFIGYTPQLLAGAWVGCDDKFIGVGLGEGSRAAMPIWGEFFKRVQGNDKLGYAKVDKFEKPAIMEGMDECDAADQVSLQRAEALNNVSRGEITEEDDAPSERGWGNENSGVNKDDYE